MVLNLGCGGLLVESPVPLPASVQTIQIASGAATVVLHTKKADRGGAKIDELEEISGTLPRKADSAVVIRATTSGHHEFPKLTERRPAATQRFCYTLHG